MSLLGFSCVLCDVPVSSGASICHDCFEDLPWMGSCCRVCGIDLTKPEGTKDNSKVSLCGACQSTPPYFDYTLGALHYQPVTAYLVSQLKFQHKLHYAAVLTKILLSYLQQNVDNISYDSKEGFPEVIIPVPLHNKRLSTRGFNQAVEIANPISKQLSIPIGRNIISRPKNTTPQSELNSKQRQKNIRDSFRIENSEHLRGVSHVVILDDVVTTGATCNELASLLKKSGVKKVGVWSVARA